MVVQARLGSEDRIYFEMMLGSHERQSNLKCSLNGQNSAQKRGQNGDSITIFPEGLLPSH